MKKACMLATIVAAAIGCSCSKSNDVEMQNSNEAQTAAAAADSQNQDFKIEATNSAVAHVSSQVGSSQISAQSQQQITLPSENLVLQANAVSTDKVGRLIQGEKFDAFVNQLASESNKNPLAQDVTALEKKNIENFFGNKGSLRNFACGTSVCAGTIALGNDPSFYKKFSDAFLDSGPANASLLDYQVKLDNGDFEQRLVMSVDPTMKGITVPNHP